MRVDISAKCRGDHIWHDRLSTHTILSPYLLQNPRYYIENSTSQDRICDFLRKSHDLSSLLAMNDGLQCSTNINFLRLCSISMVIHDKMSWIWIWTASILALVAYHKSQVLFLSVLTKLYCTEIRCKVFYTVFWSGLMKVLDYCKVVYTHFIAVVL